MQAEFWHERWKDNLIGFHQQQVNPYLVEYWDKLGLETGATVFVPLCGKSSDMLWLVDQGVKVMGVELSELAVQQFFDENKLSYETQQQGAFSVWTSSSIRIYCGDFFQLTQADLADVSCVFDRAALVALPTEMRVRYAQKMNADLPTSANILQVTMEYQQQYMNGPPFSVTEAEVKQYYAEKYCIENLQSKNILTDNPKFAQSNMTYLNEVVCLLTRK